MHIVRQFLSKIGKWEYTPLALLVLALLLLHFGIINRPDTTAFDETFYVKAARSAIDGSGLMEVEHPPLGQAIIALGVLIFGDNPLGWRFFSVIFGSVSVVLFYLICRQLKLTKFTSTLATFLLAIETLTFVESGVAMLDVYSVTFMFLSFWLYLKGKYSLAGITIGLSALSKLSGVLTLLCITLHLLLTDRKNARRIFPVAAISAATFLVLLPLVDYSIVHKFVNPITHIRDMTFLIMSITFAKTNVADYQWLIPTRPWQWLYHFNGYYWWWFNAAKQRFDYYMRINPAVWILIIPSLVYLAYAALKRNKAAIFLSCWFGAIYLFWIPASIITDRTSYDYYFYPAVGVICIAISMASTQVVSLRNHPTIASIVYKFGIPTYLAANLIFFILLFINAGSINVLFFLGMGLFVAVFLFLVRLMHNELLLDRRRGSGQLVLDEN
jgi:dolichyl-phosphate-mannose-protein mannosyltransferase